MKPPKLAPGDKLVKRRQAAALYGCSEPTIRRFERDGSLPPVYIDAANVRWHSQNAILALKEKRAAAAAGPALEIGGGVAGDAFAAYDDGATPADVVKTLRIAPNQARQLQDEWADLAGGFFVGGHVRAKLVEMMAGFDETNPVATGEDLLRLLDHMEVPRCASGCDSWARFCMACFRNRPRQALHAVAKEVAAMEERKKRAAEREARKRAVEQARQARRVARGKLSDATLRTRSSATPEPGRESPSAESLASESPAQEPSPGGSRDFPCAATPIPGEAHLMSDDEITALIAQIRKTVALMKQPEPLSEEDAVEFRACVAMLEGLSTHRGSGRDITNEQAIELATVMGEFREAAIAQGVEMPSFEESSAVATELTTAPKPTEKPTEN